jgi:hypothetical protein
MIKVTGIVKHQNIGVGTWTLIGDAGETYELYNPPESIRQDGLKVSVEGRIREDIMTIAMVGKILEIMSLC